MTMSVPLIALPAESSGCGVKSPFVTKFAGDVLSSMSAVII
jgi:hypothetical protein